MIAGEPFASEMGNTCTWGLAGVLTIDTPGGIPRPDCPIRLYRDQWLGEKAKC
jgi:hypothetical protein